MIRRGLLVAGGLALLAATGCANKPSGPGASGGSLSNSAVVSSGRGAGELPPPSFAPPAMAPVASGQAPRRYTLPPAQAVTTLPPTVNGVPRDWIPLARPRAWSWIIIHHTATPSGALARIDSSHRSKGWENGAGYDFVIGNGTESRDGQIEVGPRWKAQIDGAHTHTPDQRFNKLGIGIVLVGNFDETRPSKKQMESAARLVAYLMRTYRIPADRVLGHRDTKATDCPGRFTNVAMIRRLATQMLADAGEEIPKSGTYALSADTELLKDLPAEATAGEPGGAAGR